MRILVYLLFYFSAALAYGQEIQELMVAEAIDIYQKPNSKSEIMGQLDIGDSVVIFSGSSKVWRKIEVEFEDKTEVAWIRVKDIKKSKIRFRRDGRSLNTKMFPHYFQNYSVGLTLLGNYTYFAAHKAEGVDSSGADVGDLSGSSIFFGLQFDVPWLDEWALRFYVSNRQAKLKGLSEGISASVESAKTDVEMLQNFLAAGVLFKYYGKRTPYWWFGAGAEVARGSSVDFSFDNTKVTVSDESLPVFAFVSFASGIDYLLYENIYLNTDIRLLYALNAEAAYVAVDYTLGISYTY